MLIGIPAEILDGENRVAATPETVKKFVSKGLHRVLVQQGAGSNSSFPDGDYEVAGATLVASATEIYERAELVLKVQRPNEAEVAMLKRGQVLIGLLQPHNESAIQRLKEVGVIGFAMERLPRISRAQSMDVLSSQANLAGYKAVLMAANAYKKFMPMLMTA
ncbi:MAG: NAD(P)(+) transhydrogenase (Re/Si-specific) subunit alpha, partial [Proteobacteria bacterium]|nr:NAD(P)(+) transhydrogenase (Re/Si-specific) subunit alpha [Pseudomonadota bacterium]